MHNALCVIFICSPAREPWVGLTRDQAYADWVWSSSCWNEGHYDMSDIWEFPDGETMEDSQRCAVLKDNGKVVSVDCAATSRPSLCYKKTGDCECTGASGAD